MVKSDKLVEGRLNGWRGVSGETPSTSVEILPQEPTRDLTNDDVGLILGGFQILKRANDNIQLPIGGRVQLFS